jgi:predicted DNA-binding transcriptional regulator YafY
MHRKMLGTIEDYLNINGPYLSAAQAAARLGVTPRTVQRYRAFLRGLASQTPGGTA